jgi:Zn-dependent peptidase ImmA (M78 family)/transcriptional regulator with XRE-family HTH domain
MPTVLPVPIHHAVLLWARKESGYPIERVAERLQVKAERIVEWEQGDRVPTLRQVEALAHFYHRPLSIFFQPKPPVTMPLAAEYRRLPGVVVGQESPELRLALRKMSARRETMIQLLVELGEATPAFDLTASLQEAPPIVAARLRSALGVSLEAQLDWPNEWHAWAAWRAAVERLGVLVFQFPKVPLEEARGLSLLRSPLPVAAVNSKETPEPRSFTLIHEVVHLMLAGGQQEVPAARETRSDPAWAQVERFAEETVSNTLVPEAALAAAISNGRFPRNGWDIGDMRALARRFRITPLALATRVRASGYISWAFYQEWRSGWDAYVATLAPKAGGFAHPIAQTLSRAGRPFTQVVLEALAANRITAVNASRYLDLKFEHFDKLKESLTARPGSRGSDE